MVKNILKNLRNALKLHENALQSHENFPHYQNRSKSPIRSTRPQK